MNQYKNNKQASLALILMLAFQTLVRGQMPLDIENFIPVDAIIANSTIVKTLVMNTSDPNDYIPAIVLPDLIKSNSSMYNITVNSTTTSHQVGSTHHYSLHNNTYLLDSFNVDSFEYYCNNCDKNNESKGIISQHIIFNTSSVRDIPVSTGIFIGTDQGTWTNITNSNLFSRGNQTEGIILSMFIRNVTLGEGNLLNCTVVPINPRVAFKSMGSNTNVTKISSESNFNSTSRTATESNSGQIITSAITKLATNENPSNCQSLCGTTSDYKINKLTNVYYCGDGDGIITNDDDMCAEVEGNFTLLDINYDIPTSTIKNPSIDFPDIEGFSCDNCYAYIGATAGIVINSYSHYVYEDEDKWYTWIEYTAFWVQGEAKAGYDLAWNNPTFSDTYEGTLFTSDHTTPIAVGTWFDISFQGILGIELDGEFTIESEGKCSASFDYGATLGGFYQDMTYETDDDSEIDDNNLHDDNGDDGWQFFKPIQNKWNAPSCVANNFNGAKIDATALLKTRINTKITGLTFPLDFLKGVLTLDIHPTLEIEALMEMETNSTFNSTSNSTFYDDEVTFAVDTTFDVSTNIGISSIEVYAFDKWESLVKDYMSDYFEIGPKMEFDFTVDAYSYGEVTWTLSSSVELRRRRLFSRLLSGYDKDHNLKWNHLSNIVHNKERHELLVQDCSTVNADTLTPLKTKHFFQTSDDLEQFKEELKNVTMPGSNQYFVINGMKIQSDSICSITLDTSSYTSNSAYTSENIADDDTTLNFEKYPFAHSTSGIILFCVLAAIISASFTLGVISAYQHSKGRRKQLKQPDLQVQAHNPDVENSINNPVISNSV